MNFEPQKFFIGLIDFFSIILPGALLTYLVGNSAWERVVDNERPIPSGAEGWIVFLFASYLLGHFIFLLSAWMDEFYDWARKATLDRQIKQLAWHGWLMPWCARFPLWLVFKRERNVAVDRAGRIKKHYLGKIGSADAVNHFQWCKARLAIEHPESLATVQRFEADSKFFRSLVVVLFVLLVWYAVQPRFGVAATCALLLILAFWRYMEQRHKATNQAYWSVITLEGKNGNLTMTTAQAKPDASTHAGGIVFKGEGKDRKYLLVQAKKTPDEWVLPKGHIELDEHPRETAVREVREETGVLARIVPKANVPGIQTYEVERQQVRVQFYIMEALAEGPSEDRWRECKWLPFEEACHHATHDLTKDMLTFGEQRRSAS